MPVTSPFNIKKWIDENRHLLKPPVGNQQIWKDKVEDFIVMIVGGPNARKDYHYNEGEEFFYQIEGNIVVKIIENGQPRNIELREGEIFLLPPKIPHSPQRPANTIGMVVERTRRKDEKDGLQWYCEKCNNKLHEEYFVLEDIVKQLKDTINKYYDSEKLRTCNKCGTIMQIPK